MIHRKEAQEGVTDERRVDPLPSDAGEGEGVALEEDEGVATFLAEAHELGQEAAAARLCEEVGVQLVEGPLALDDGAGLVTLELVVACLQAGGASGEGDGAGAWAVGRRDVVPHDEVGGEREGTLLAFVDQDGPRALHEARRSVAEVRRRTRARRLGSACEKRRETRA